MDLAVILPLAVLLFLQAFLSLLLLSPRALSQHVASLLSLTRTNTVIQTVIFTVAAAVGAMTTSSIIQLAGVVQSMKVQNPFGDRAMALTIEELRALLATVLGLSNMVLIFLNRALGYEQQQLDKAQLNLSVLQKQAAGLQSEYMRATSSKDKPDATADHRSEVAKLIQDKQRLQAQLEEAQAEQKAAAANLTAVKSQAKGLEREYDRLLSECDMLKRQLARADANYSSGGDKKFD